MRKLLVLLCVMLALMLIPVACTADTPKDDADLNIEDSEDEISDNGADDGEDAEGGNINGGDRLSYGDIKLSPEEAFDIFKKTYPKGKVKEIELEEKNGSYVYEVEGYDGIMEYEIKINPFNGNILETEQDDDNTTEGEILREDLSRISDFIGRSLDDTGNDFITAELMEKDM
ncbi:MAG: hypothetical protein GX329_07040 [Tissierellia bacterium]|nr:hypothetical protein [Tissierellia bacterium]